MMYKMSRVFITAVLVLASCVALAQTLEDRLPFTAAQSGTCPKGWSCNPQDTIALDGNIVHSGKWSVRIDRTPASSAQFSGILTSIPIDFGGKTIELRGFIRSKEVTGFAAFWIREDTASGPMEFASMQQKNPVLGTTGWSEHSVSVPVNPNAERLVFGFLQSGAGTSWADNLSLWVDGKPLAQAAKRPVVQTVLDTDHEFDNGSRIEIGSMSPRQIDNLVTLCRVWGFAKYHHPAIVSGQRQFDYELFRILPAVLAAPDRDSANAAIAQWMAGLGSVTPCKSCEELKRSHLFIAPDLAWLHDTKMLGVGLSRALLDIYENRQNAQTQFYVSLAPGVGNPVFAHEMGYPAIKFPDSGFQLLALFRYWNIIEYWYPNRNLIGDEWARILPEFLPRIALARDSNNYQLQLMQLIARVQDTHANLWSSLSLRPPSGACAVPVQVRFAGNEPVILHLLHSDVPLKVGDVIREINGTPVDTLVSKWTPYYADSNQAARLRDIANTMTQGDCTQPAALTILRAGETLTIKADRLPLTDAAFSALQRHDRPGPVLQKLTNDIGYLKLSAVNVQDAAKYIDMAAGTKGMVIDIRNYPSAFVVFELGNHLVDKASPFATFTVASLTNPGAFYWAATESLEPVERRYNGKIAILVDEITQSQAEYTAMAFRTSPQAAVIGSTTAGADGNVSHFALPGGFSTMISGIGVFYPDHKPTQRVGILPDIRITPTVDGIREGRDEVLEAAIRYINAQ